jgi:protein-disulfide isomerase
MIERSEYKKMKIQGQKNRFRLLFVSFLFVFLGACSESPSGREIGVEPAAALAPQGVTTLPVRGDASAVVTIEEFSDFQCPFCARSVPVLKQIMADFPGQVRWVFRHFPVISSHPQAALVHMAVLAAGKQGRFWEMHDAVFENRDRVSRQELLGYARKMGLDLNAFEASLQDRSLMTRIETDYNEGADRLVRATPTFFVNGRKIEGALPYPMFRREVELAILAAGKKGPAAP